MKFTPQWSGLVWLTIQRLSHFKVQHQQQQKYMQQKYMQKDNATINSATLRSTGSSRAILNIGTTTSASLKLNSATKAPNIQKYNIKIQQH